MQFSLISPNKSQHMLTQFEKLTESDRKIIIQTPIWVAIWVGMADNHFDKKEMAKAVQVMKIKTFSEKPEIAEIYKQIQNPEEELLKIVDSLPQSVSQSQEMVKKELMNIKNILETTDKDFAINFYNSLKNLAVHIANASGGMLSVGSISEEEKEAINLEFLKPF
jgi:tellurite resistance protein